MKLKDCLSINLGLGDLSTSPYFYSTIIRECSTFLQISGGKPLYKTLRLHPTQTKSPVRKVKVRYSHFKEGSDYKILSEMFGRDFPSQIVPTSSSLPSISSKWEDVEPHYVFPINGFEFISSSLIRDITKDQTMFEQAKQEKYHTKFNELVRESYQTKSLFENILESNEIILYNIPYFYALPVKSVHDYQQIVQMGG